MTDQQIRDAIPMYQPGELSAGVYTASEKFRAVELHSCVCRKDTMEIVAVTGPATDARSQRDSDLFAAAPELLQACQIAVINCPCSLKERQSGHRIDCYAPMLQEVIAKAIGTVPTEGDAGDALVVAERSDRVDMEHG